MRKQILSTLLGVFFVLMGYSAQAQEVTLNWVEPGTGDVRIQEESFHIDQEIEVKVNGQLMQTVKQAVTEEKKRKDSYTGDDTVKVDYIRQYEKTVMNEAPNETTHEVEGKSYLVSRTDDGVEVERAGEGEDPLTDVERSKVAEDFKDLGKPDKFGKVFAGQTFKVDEPFEVPEDVRKDLFDDDQSMKLETLTLTLKETKEVDGVNVAVFEMKFEVRGEEEPDIKISMDLVGPAVVQVDTGWPVSIDLEGEINMTGSDPATNMEMSGGGNAEMKLAATYSKE